MLRSTKVLVRSLPFLLVGTNRLVSTGFRGRLGLSGSGEVGITSSCISSLIICGSRRVSVCLGRSWGGDCVGTGCRGPSFVWLISTISRSSSSSMTIGGSLGVTLGGGGVTAGCSRSPVKRVWHRFRKAEPLMTHLISSRELANDILPIRMYRMSVTVDAEVRCPELLLRGAPGVLQ